MAGKEYQNIRENIEWRGAVREYQDVVWEYRDAVWEYKFAKWDYEGTIWEYRGASLSQFDKNIPLLTGQNFVSYRRQHHYIEYHHMFMSDVITSYRSTHDICWPS